MIARAKEHGSALVFVLWIALLISILAAGATLAVRSRILDTRVEMDVMREEAALRSALDIAAWSIALEGRNGVARLPRVVPVGDYRIEVSRAPTQDRIDINLADETAWQRVFAAAGAPQEVSAQLIDQILDWRDPDTRVRPLGAERPQYPQSGTKRIGDRPFLSVDELLQVRDMTPARLACITPYLTIFGGTGAHQGAPLEGLEPPVDTNGIRVAMQARIIKVDGRPGRSLMGLAQYGVSDVRPYEWVYWGGDDGQAPTCSPGAF